VAPSALLPPLGGPLPQRVPRATGLRGDSADRGQVRRAPLDAGELRRKLAGLQAGSQAGRRDAEIEFNGDAAKPAAAAEGAADTVEEATR
jgi:hypothetical protein